MLSSYSAKSGTVIRLKFNKSGVGVIIAEAMTITRMAYYQGEA